MWKKLVREPYFLNLDGFMNSLLTVKHCCRKQRNSFKLCIMELIWKENKMGVRCERSYFDACKYAENQNKDQTQESNE